MRELIDERNERRTVLNQTAACVRISDIAHLLIGNVEKPRELLAVGRRLVQHDTRWFYSVFFTSRCDKAFQMKEIGRISADIVTPKCLKVVPVVVPEVVP